MLSTSTIDTYMDSIPPVPEVVRRCIEALDKGDLVRAADIASEDRALIRYLKNIVNRPFFGFVGEIKNVRQIFGIFGLLKAKQLMYGYYLLLILPKEWKVFDFNSTMFQDFQARLIYQWDKITKFLKEESVELVQAISLIPATLIVCEMLFRDSKDTVKLLKEKKHMCYETILFKMTDRTFFDIASVIASKWEFSPKMTELLLKIGNVSEGEFGQDALAIQYIRLLIIYEMSRPIMINSGLNDLFDFELIFDEEITDNFYKIIEES